MPERLRIVVCGDSRAGKTALTGRLLEGREAVADRARRSAPDARDEGGIDCTAALGRLPDEGGADPGDRLADRHLVGPRRGMVLVDVPGGGPHTRNLANAASTADLAVVLVDAARRVESTAVRDSRVAAMFGARHIVLAVNKMDLVSWDRGRFDDIVATYRDVAQTLDLDTFHAIPISALGGENLVRRSEAAPWYDGPTLLDHLDAIEVDSPGDDGPFRFSVQDVRRPDGSLGCFGRVAAGTASVGERVRIAPLGAEAEIASIVAGHEMRQSASHGESVTLGLSRDLDVGRGDVIAAASDPVEISDQFQAEILWTDDEPLVAGRPYLMQIHGREVVAVVTRIKHRIEPEDGSERPARTLGVNDIGTVNLATDQPVPFMPYDASRTLGGFALIDRETNATACTGTIDFPLRRASNIQWQTLEVTRASRAGLKLQRPLCLWLTGLSGSGKSTVANLLEGRLLAEGRHTYLLDGDNVRHGLNRDLGFTEADRVENIRRVSEVAKLMVDAGLIVIVAFISPYRTERAFARNLFAEREFAEVFVDAPLATCEARDAKGLYAKARRGELKNFTGIDSAYEPPLEPEIHLDTDAHSAEDCVEIVMRFVDDWARPG